MCLYPPQYKIKRHTNHANDGHRANGEICMQLLLALQDQIPQAITGARARYNLGGNQGHPTTGQTNPNTGHDQGESSRKLPGGLDTM